MTTTMPVQPAEPVATAGGAGARPAPPPTAGAGMAEPASMDAHPGAADVAPGVREQALVFDAAGYPLVGVLSCPTATAPQPLGVVIVVGGPQYRVGSHRQFVQLARALARAGHAVLRFDVRGMGDADGAPRAFEAIDDDVAAALQALRTHAPGVDGAVLLGLCDGASAALLYLQRRGADPFVRGLVVLNPWVRSPATQAATQVKHYYVQRLRSPAFWRKLLGGGVRWSALAELAGSLRAMRRRAPASGGSGTGSEAALAADAPFQQRMAVAWTAFAHPVLLLLSGNDYTAREFEEAVAAGGPWTGALARAGLTVQRLDGADHTLSEPAHSRAAEAAVAAWLSGLSPVGVAADARAGAARGTARRNEAAG